ncbi:flagellar hook-basal body complex protein FliE [Manganibacter manganicus]|uniref:Flagellar hook-basal body complex protein FliE n=1 Tax=Manganibacter manganicus TaxID=1873176 RepID=A0A1V8RV57_9HYPH|nr:flagellar hook-basal body complex protein FliE [Pseudaminobacter manganicus]OQM77033.1 flagellar hook-basal body protein FliE [Pseudaminobacter manganicus]
MIGPIDTLHLKPAIDTNDGLGISAGKGAEAVSGADATSFTEALRQAAEQSVGTLEKAEHISLQALKGEADTRQVVDAVMNAQQTLQAAIAIRDKIVSAYLEVSRMSI